MKKGIIILLIALGLVGYTVYSNMNHPSPQPTIKKTVKMAVGYLAPDFQLQGMDGKTYKLSALKKPVIVNFWASWCGPCRMESPHLEEMYKKYHGKFEILAVNATSDDKEVNARKFAKLFGFTFPVLLDRKGDIGELYQLQGYPTNIFINKNREIVQIQTGLMPPADMEKLIQKMVD